MQDNFPAWLKSPPDGDFPSPPVNTHAQTLPFGELTWENFERLILRMVRRDASISECWVYGTKGQEQHGLDILAARDETPTDFSCYQCKKVKKFTAGKIEEAVDTFLKGKWVNKTKCFILCTSLALDETKQVDAISSQYSLLAAEGIEFVVWDGSDGGKLSEQLKNYPELVDDFFHREWVRRFNGSEAADLLGARLHGAQLADLRSQLKEVYTTLFLRHDPGLRLGSQRPAPLLDRYVAPVVIETREIVMSELAPDVNTLEREGQYSSGNEMRRSPSPVTRTSSIQEIRTPIGEWLSQHDKTVILGEPGYGKSALLRVITLQLMNNRDDLFQLPWGEFLPVWVSFGGFSAAIQDQPSLSLQDYFDMWLNKNGVDDARPLFRRAIEQRKILLLVDGLDEGQDINAAKQAMDRISTFLSVRATPAVFTSRPRGYKRVGPDGEWPIARLGSFDEDQIESFSQKWFEYLETPETKQKDEKKGYLLNARQRTSDFLKVVRENLRIMDLARTPLFCQLLIDIFRFSHHLPEQRIKVYEKIVGMLLSDHPAARLQAAGLTQSDAPRSEDMREMLMSLALHIEEKGGAGVISTVDCKALFCNFLTDDMNGPGFSNYEAKHQAQSIVDHAQTGLGLIVERAPEELGFFHLSIQEYLAAQAMVRKDEKEQLAWLVRIWNEPKWHEVVLAWFSIRGADQGKGATQRAIDHLKNLAISPWAQLQLILLRTELAANDLGLSPREARSTIDEAADQVEISPYPELRQALAKQITLGLRTPSIANYCEARITNWVPGRSDWKRADLLRVLGNWQSSEDLLRTLKLALHDESLICRQAAAECIAKVFSGDLAIGDDLATMATNWPDTTVRTSAMYCLWKGWPNHEALPSLADNARSSMDFALVLTGITIRVSKGNFDEDDRKNIWLMFVSENLPYELENECREVLVQGWGKDGEFKRIAMEGLQNAHSFTPRMKQFIAFLARAWPGDTEVACSIAHHFRSSSPYFIHDDGHWNALIAGFRGNAILSKALREALSEHLSNYGSIHWGPDTKQVYCTIGDETAKSELLEAYLTATNSTDKFWICSTLMEVWSSDSEVNELLIKEFLKPPGEVAYLGNWVELFIPERKARRNWLLEAIMNPERGLALSAPVRTLLHEFHDEECLRAIKTVLAKDIWYYHKVDFQSRLIEIFPNDDDVREWVEAALNNCDGPSIASIAASHEKNPTIRARLLAAARPAKTNVRSEVFQILREHPIPIRTVQQLTSNIWAEDNGAIRTSGVLARCIVAQQLPELRVNLVEKLQEELNSLGSYYEERRCSSFAGLLQLGEYEACIDTLTIESPSAHHWLAQYHKTDSLTVRTLFEHWDKLNKTSQTQKQPFELPFGAFVYNGTAREALVNDTTRALLIEYLKTIPIQDRSPKSFSLMAELLPSSPELRSCLIETIMNPSISVTGLESQRIYAEQFAGDEQALNELKNLWSAPAKANNSTQDLSPYLYALVLGWPDDQELRSFLQQGMLPELPIPTVLAMCSLKEDRKKVSVCIDRMIEATQERGYSLPTPFTHSLRTWADRKSTRLNSSHIPLSRMPSSA